MERREFLQALAATGVGTASVHRAISVQWENRLQNPSRKDHLPDHKGTPLPENPLDENISFQMVKDACWVVGAKLSDDQCKKLADVINHESSSLKKFRALDLPASDSPSVFFQPLNPPTTTAKADRSGPNCSHWVRVKEQVELPDSDDLLAFQPVWKLSSLIRTRKISSTDLAKLYIRRLKLFGANLNCVVNLTEKLALKQAAQADKEIQQGKIRGPLHGIPWGAKDLIAVNGYPTTWGIPQFKNRELPEQATVSERLNQAGAVLVAKLSLGAIAMGDRWYEGQTKNPWNLKQGSSGSSAGSASATAAGLVGFSLGSETLGSILSPSQRCGTTGFRPTFGRVSRHGCMPLSWTMDKIGPITRCVHDSAMIFSAIHGKDSFDQTTANYPVNFLKKSELTGMKVGYLKRGRRPEKRSELVILKNLGLELVPIELPRIPYLQQMLHTIDVEGAAVFEQMLIKDDTDGWNSWPGSFRRGQFVSAVDYLKVMRLRRRLMDETEELFEKVDFLVNARDIFITNLTGHPSITLPRKIRKLKGRAAITNDVMTGKNFRDGNLLSLAHFYQQEVTGHLQRPTLDFPPMPKKLDNGN